MVTNGTGVDKVRRREGHAGGIELRRLVARKHLTQTHEGVDASDWSFLSRSPYCRSVYSGQISICVGVTTMTLGVCVLMFLRFNLPPHAAASASCALVHWHVGTVREWASREVQGERITVESSATAQNRTEKQSPAVSVCLPLGHVVDDFSPLRTHLRALVGCGGGHLACAYKKSSLLSFSRNPAQALRFTSPAVRTCGFRARKREKKKQLRAKGVDFPSRYSIHDESHTWVMQCRRVASR